MFRVKDTMFDQSVRVPQHAQGDVLIEFTVEAYLGARLSSVTDVGPVAVLFDVIPSQLHIQYEIRRMYSRESIL